MGNEKLQNLLIYYKICYLPFAVNYNRSFNVYIFTVYHLQRYKPIWNAPLLVGNWQSVSHKNLKMLGITFSHLLDWKLQIDSAINKLISLMYSFKFCNAWLSRNQLKTLINAHFHSKLTYASQVWSGSISLNLKKLESCYFKMLRLLCSNYRGKKSWIQLLVKSGMISLRSLFVMRDVKLLHKLCSSLIPEPRN